MLNKIFLSLEPVCLQGPLVSASKGYLSWGCADTRQEESMCFGRTEGSVWYCNILHNKASKQGLSIPSVSDDSMGFLRKGRECKAHFVPKAECHSL